MRPNTFTHRNLCWPSSLIGEAVALPWKRDKDEWPIYPVMNDIVSVMHGSQWTPDKPSMCETLFDHTHWNLAVRYVLTDQCEPSQRCQEKKFWCVNVASGKELGSMWSNAWCDTFTNAVKKCKQLGASILTMNLTTRQNTRLLKGESAWTGSRRFNE